MTYTEAQMEFNLRLYRWSMSALQHEINQSFPSFKFCGDFPSKTLLFLNSLDENSKMMLGNALLLSRHQNYENAPDFLNQPFSDEVLALMRREEALRLKTTPSNLTEYFSVKKAPLPAAANRRLLKKKIKEHFLDLYGSECLPADPLDGKDELLFRMRCCGWIIKTSFDFGRWSPEITYEHIIWTGKWITKEEPGVLFANAIGFRLNYGCEIGIGSEWGKITVENIDSVCAEIMGHCQKMFDAFPNLLKGLELENLKK